MKKIMQVLLALLLVGIGSYPAKAANESFTLKVEGGIHKVSGQVTLSSLTSSAQANLDSQGKATFKLFPGKYNIKLNLDGVFLGLTGGTEISVPGTFTLKLPEPKLSMVEFKLPSGQSLGNVYNFYPSERVTFVAHGASWSAPLMQPVENKDGKITFSTFVAQKPSGARNLSFALPGGSTGLPSGKPSLTFEQLSEGGIVQLNDGAFPNLSTKSISAASGSTFTVEGDYILEGDGQAGMLNVWITGNYFFTVRGPLEFSILNQKSRPQSLGVRNLNEKKFTITLPISANGKYLYVYSANANSNYPAQLIPISVRLPKSSYKNCATLNLDFQGGVSNSRPSDPSSFVYAPTLNPQIYKSVKGLDRDKDGIACEK